jgi:hypothetical protein
MDFFAAQFLRIGRDKRTKRILGEASRLRQNAERTA